MPYVWTLRTGRYLRYLPSHVDYAVGALLVTFVVVLTARCPVGPDFDVVVGRDLYVCSSRTFRTDLRCYDSPVDIIYRVTFVDDHVCYWLLVGYGCAIDIVRSSVICYATRWLFAVYCGRTVVTFGYVTLVVLTHAVDYARVCPLLYATRCPGHTLARTPLPMRCCPVTFAYYTTHVA